MVHAYFRRGSRDHWDAPPPQQWHRRPLRGTWQTLHLPHWRDLWARYAWSVQPAASRRQTARLLARWQTQGVRDFLGRPWVLSPHMVQQLTQDTPDRRWRWGTLLVDVLRSPLEVWQQWDAVHAEWRWYYLAPLRVGGRAYAVIAAMHPHSGRVVGVTAMSREDWSSVHKLRQGLLRFRNYPLASKKRDEA